MEQVRDFAWEPSTCGRVPVWLAWVFLGLALLTALVQFGPQ